ncbi:uncharacterized protein A1O5_06838 [Cladophialophora psammophila CBS 110553]|uniref:CENP-V/GFA domain-containing protein n=1 Tax=Cladophialophora psammophila CBS 110553 TaxID=1182543 RepID=W9WNI7_9EURO|nr:uncharacterized protein A1O5_06838 [Cladophialophora psammophila CBS 110553]EXJ69767.1 hypothetical protein A1O5_06838 [Cladophialophora psammophila CBS 110553]
MPLPKRPLILHGGCNCRAIRFRISVPGFADRPLAPYRSSHTGGAASVGVDDNDTRVPFVLIDHCNDCRRATSAALPMCIVTETRTVEISCLPREGVADRIQARRDKDLNDESRHWSPIEPVLTCHESLSTIPFTTPSTLGHYVSSPGRNRWFCANCGTPLAYSVSEGSLPKDWHWPKMFDIWLGTLDREDLVNEWMRPDHALWCHFAVPWIADTSRAGARRLVVEDEIGIEAERGTVQGHKMTAVKTAPVPRHPLFMIDQMEESTDGGDNSEAS